MMYERLVLMRDLLSEDGSIYVHCDWRVNSLLRLVLDEVFGKHNFRNEIIWHYGKMANSEKNFSFNHDTIFRYSKTDNFYFKPIKGGESEYKERYKRYLRDNKIFWKDVKHSTDKLILKRKRKVEKELKKVVNDNTIFFDFNKEFKLQSDVIYVSIIKGNAEERTDYPTQKPKKLLERIIKASSNQGDIVCDFFGGSGTTAAVSEKLNRKWICADLGKFAIHTTRKRIIEVQRDSKSKGSPYRPFELLNLGKYHREYFIYDSNEHSKLDQIKRLEKEKQFEKLVLQAYQAQPIQNFRTFSGKKNLRMVSIGPVNQPVDCK